MENQVLEAIKTRRSIRKYKPEQITDEELLAVLEAGFLLDQQGNGDVRH